MNAQEPYKYSFGPWHLTHLSGEAKLNGNYREQSVSRKNYDDKQNSYLLSGGLKLLTKHNIINENFITFFINGEYNPETSKKNYVVIPDQSEVRTLNRIEFGATLLPKYEMNANISGNYSESYNNRENLTNLKSSDYSIGASYNFRNKYLPVNLSYNLHEFNHQEISTTRKFSYCNSSLKGLVSKNFGKNNTNDLSIFRNDYKYNADEKININNVSNNFVLKNTLQLGEKNKYTFNSNILGTDQTGHNTYSRFIVAERLKYVINKNAKLTGHYNYNRFTRPGNINNSHNLRATLGHQYYLSIHTEVFAEKGIVFSSLFKEGNTKFGINLDYTKKIPKGRFNFSYHYYKHLLDKKSDSLLQWVYGESHILSDGQIILLSRPNINLSSIVVKNNLQSITYSQNLDYSIIKIGDYIEIQRIPGGQIPNNTEVLIDYSFDYVEQFNQDINNHYIYTSVEMFKQLFEIYYRMSQRDYSKTNEIDPKYLNYFTSHAYGIKLEYKQASAGAEYEEYKSNILPYFMYKYYASYTTKIYGKFIFNLNANGREYKLVSDEISQKYWDILIGGSYDANSKTKALCNIGYRYQTGRNMNLEMFTFRTELFHAFRNFETKLGFEFLKRNYIGEKVKFNNVYINISRKFN